MTSLVSTPLLRKRGWGWAAGCGIAVMGIVTMMLTDALTAVIVVALLAGLLLALHRPHWCLITAIALSPAGGEVSALSGIALAIALGAGATSVVVMLASRRVALPIEFTLPLLLLLWMLIRFTIEGTDLTARTVLGCIALFPLMMHSNLRGHSLRATLSIAGGAFVTLTALAPLAIEQGVRFAGFSGNPNRMVFALLVFLPFMIALTVQGRRGSLRFGGIVLSLASVGMIILSGSSQGIVGLAVLVLVALTAVTRSWSPLSRRAITATLIVGGTACAGVVLAAVEWSDDLLTLSDRTPLFSAAFEAFLRTPILGSGLDSVSHGDVLERSAHSVPLALLAAGGVLAGAAWIGLLAQLVFIGLRRLRHGDLLVAVTAALVVIQFVQTVQFMLLTWAVVALAVERWQPSATTREQRMPVD